MVSYPTVANSYSRRVNAMKPPCQLYRMEAFKCTYPSRLQCEVLDSFLKVCNFCIGFVQFLPHNARLIWNSILLELRRDRHTLRGFSRLLQFLYKGNSKAPNEVDF